MRGMRVVHFGTNLFISDTKDCDYIFTATNMFPSSQGTHRETETMSADLSNLLSGHDTSAACGLKIFLISMQEQNQVCMEERHLQSTEITIFHIDYDPDRERRLPNPAPPPKLHYTTFWRSIGKRAYHQNQDKIIRSARESKA